MSSADASVVSCPFCRIAQGAQSAALVYQDDATVAFLDHRPVFPGHVLVVSRQHHETLADLPAGLLSRLFLSVQLVARAVERGMEADGTLVGVNNRVSQSVPHVHVHVVPRRFHDGLRGFFWPRQPYSDDAEMERVRLAIENAVARLQET